MQKIQIARTVAEQTNLPLIEVQIVLDATINAITSAINLGQPVYLRGLGSFSIVERKHKPAYDFHRHKCIDVPVHKSVKFIPSKFINIK